MYVCAATGVLIAHAHHSLIHTVVSLLYFFSRPSQWQGQYGI
jgi:hypothetical protein